MNTQTFPNAVPATAPASTTGIPGYNGTLPRFEGNLIAMLGHYDAEGTLFSKIDFSTSDKDGLQGLELVLRQAMTKAIEQHDVGQFRKSYVAMERIQGIDMENYEGLEWALASGRENRQHLPLGVVPGVQGLAHRCRSLQAEPGPHGSRHS